MNPLEKKEKISANVTIEIKPPPTLLYLDLLPKFRDRGYP